MEKSNFTILSRSNTRINIEAYIFELDEAKKAEEIKKELLNTIDNGQIDVNYLEDCIVILVKCIKKRP